MKKLLLLSSLFILVFSFSACSTRNESKKDTPEKTTNQNKEEQIKKETIQTTSSTVVDGIKSGDTVSSPVSITGKTEAARNKLFVELRDSEHASKVRGYAVVTENENAKNDFKITLNFVFSSTKEGYIAVYELDNEGQEKNLVEIPVKFEIAE